MGHVVKAHVMRATTIDYLDQFRTIRYTFSMQTKRSPRSCLFWANMHAWQENHPEASENDAAFSSERLTLPARPCRWSDPLPLRACLPRHDGASSPCVSQSDPSCP